MRRAASWMCSMAALVFLAGAVPSPAGADGWRGHGWRSPARYGHRWHAHHWRGHHRAPRVVIGLGSGLWLGAPRLWHGPPVVYVRPRPVYVTPPRVIVGRRPVYVERVSPSSYWYYCRSAGGYYPRVPSCPDPWVPVPPGLK